MNKVLLVLSVGFFFGITWVVSFNFALVVIAPMILLAILFLGNPFPQPKNNIYIILAFIILFLFIFLINITLYNHIDYYYINEFLKKIVFTLSLFSFIILFYSSRKELLIKSIDYTLLIIVVLWYMQFVIFYSTGEYIDLLDPLPSGRPQRYQAYWIQSALPFEVIRPTSIYVEPGTYAVNTLPFLMLSFLYHEKLTKLHIFLLISYFGTLSLFAIIVASAFIFIVEISRFEFKFSKKNLLILVIFALIAIGIEQYLHFRFITEDNTGAVGLRENIIEYWLALDEMQLLLGLGNAQVVFERAAVEDASFIFKLIFEYGIFAIPYLLLMAYVSRGLPIFFLGIILITKLHYELYIVWFYFAGLHLIMEDKRSLKL